ncbi:MAG TPA: hypothetical protein V6C76_05970 [Drouetiella sp.]
MRKDVAAHKEQDSQKSYLATGISAVTGIFRADSLGAVEKLQQDLQSATTRGDDAAAQKFAAQATDVVKADQSSMQLDQQINTYGSGMIKTAGMFLPGRAGWAIAATTGVLDGAKPGEALSDQLVDGGLGLTKGVALKGMFNKVGGADMGIAAKALGLGVGSRIIDSSLTRETYQTADGYSASTGLSRIAEQSFNKRALASDLITFGLAHGAVSGIDRITGGALKSSPLMSTLATGGIFGVSSGSVQEINRQQQAGEKFDLSQVVTSATLTGITDMVASAPGAAMTHYKPAEIKSPEPTPSKPVSDAVATSAKAGAESDSQFVPIKFERMSIISQKIEGSTSRQFQLIDGNTVALWERLREQPSEPVMARVRGIISGRIGPEQNMLIQHNPESGRIPSIADNAMINYADIIASCNPKSLSETAQAKHILPQADDLFMTASSSGILNFSTVKPNEVKAGDLEPIKLGGQTVSDLLAGSGTPDYLDNTHDRLAMAKAMRHFRTPVRFVNGGADSIVFELPDHNMLKITDHGWDPSWGSREIQTSHGPRLIDAPLVQKAQTIDLEDAAITYFVQRRLRTPVTEQGVRVFDAALNYDGRFKFWDNDFKEHGRGQLGFDPKTKQIYLLDYDAVRTPDRVPKDQVNGSSWWLNRYFHGRSNYDDSSR